MSFRQLCKISSRFANPTFFRCLKDILPRCLKIVFAKCLIYQYMRCLLDSYARYLLDLQIRHFLGVWKTSCRDVLSVFIRHLKDVFLPTGTVVSQNIVSVHPSLNLYHVSSVLLLTGRSHVLSCDTKNAKNLQILFDSGSQITFISKKACNQFNLNTTQKQPPKVLCKKRCSLKFRKTHRKTPGQSQSLFFQ